MSITDATLVVFAVVLLGSLVLAVSANLRQKALGPRMDLQEEVGRLNATVDILLKRNEELRASLLKMQTELTDTTRQLAEAQARIRVLEARQTSQNLLEKRPAKPLLLVMCNRLFGEDDALAIRRTGIPFHRLKDATALDFDRYLQACRQDGTTPWWIQISAHMGADGVQFADGVKTATWLSQRIRGVRLLVMAGCDNEDVAGQLVGLAQHVVVIYEAIDTTNAQDFSYALWSRIATGADPIDAFAGALAECPQVSEFVQMRSARPVGDLSKGVGSV